MFQLNACGFFENSDKKILILIIPLSLYAQKEYPALIDTYMNAAVRVNQFSSSVLIAKHDSIIYQKTFGTLDFVNTKPLDSNSMFEIGIITEEFTAAAILMLKDEGKLQLTYPITKYFPELTYSNVTIKHLLTHTSGLPDYYDDVMKDKWGTEKYATNADIIKSLAAAKKPLAWQPGTKNFKSNYFTDYPLLASLIEKVSKQSYPDFMQFHIFMPLHLLHTQVVTGLQVKENQNTDYTESIAFDESKQKFLPADSFTYLGAEYNHVAKNIFGGRGISSTAHDLFLWDQALLYHNLLTASTVQQMFTPHALKDTANKISFGYGTLFGQNEFGNYVQQRDDGNNETLGFITTLIRYKQQDITITVLANKAKSFSNIAGALAYILFDREVVHPYIHKAVSIDTSLLGKYTGKYSLPGVTKVYKKEGTLWMTITGEPDLKLVPESPTKFFSSDKEYDWQVEFEMDNNGKVVKTYFIYSGLKKELKKS